MAWENKEGQGALFKNERKTEDSHPNLQGTIRIDGRDYYLSGWTKDGSKGRWISLSAKPKDERQ